ncbi:hypothetical protein CFB46_25455 [Burkholderia sp. HI2761]|nr:hypothetical protein [Burkholderia sp. BE24]OXJ24146.1 hypothetical protein CFB46_25455 [Burkholderia sp. HI2761]
MSRGARAPLTACGMKKPAFEPVFSFTSRAFARSSGSLIDRRLQRLMLARQSEHDELRGLGCARVA